MFLSLSYSSVQQYLDREKHFGNLNYRVNFGDWREMWLLKCASKTPGEEDAALKKLAAAPTAAEIAAAVDILDRAPEGTTRFSMSGPAGSAAASGAAATRMQSAEEEHDFLVERDYAAQAHIRWLSLIPRKLNQHSAGFAAG